jgi:diguanylate cyclase (GGDEF)-like protein
MATSHDEIDLGPRARRIFGSSAGRRDALRIFLTALVVGGLLALFDLGAVLGTWLSAPWTAPLAGAAAFMSIMAIALGPALMRRMLELGAEVSRRRDAEARLADFTAASSTWFWEMDADFHFTMVSANAPEALATLVATGEPWQPGPEQSEDEAWVHHRANLARGRPVRDFRFRIAEPDGGLRYLQISGNPVEDRSGRLLGFRGTGADVTLEALAPAEVEHLAGHDPLTDLPNRELLLERAAQALARARLQGEEAALLRLDLDRFAEINDAFGHAAGDYLVRACGERLLACLAEGDTLARVGADGFALLLANAANSDQVEALCGRLLGVLAEPFELDGQPTSPSASIGVVLIPGDGEQAEELLRRAGVALSRAKREGGARVRFFEIEMDGELQERRAREADLRRALERGEFELHYQAELRAGGDEVVGLEALLRWRHPELGLILPADFLRAAEDSGLIVPLGAWALRTACRQATLWPRMRVAVNLSAAQFVDPGLLERVRQALEESGLEAKRLELEITEGALLSAPRAASAILDRLKELGVRIAIDDFGSGYSSLGYLQKFDKIKIARSVTAALEWREEATALVRAMLGLGQSLGMEICAEGVETDAQASWLTKQGCGALQGSHLARPQEAPEIDSLIERAAGGVATLGALSDAVPVA